MFAKIFLGLTGAAFGLYGLMCLFVPETLAENAGFGLESDVALTETRAMYGGLQTAVGVLTLAAALRPALQPAVLMTLVALFAGLAGGRLVGIVLEPAPGAYNFLAFGYESASLAICWVLWRRSSPAAAAASG